MGLSAICCQLPAYSPNQILQIIVQPAVRIDLDAQRGSQKDWIAQEPVQRELATQFRAFLRNFQDDNGDYVYRARLREMCTSACCCCVLFVTPQLLDIIFVADLLLNNPPSLTVAKNNDVSSKRQATSNRWRSPSST